ncbi:MAG: NnrU family protein [Pseudomonadota bacterium]
MARGLRRFEEKEIESAQSIVDTHDRESRWNRRGALVAWAEYIAAFLLFFLTHTIPVRAPIRSLLVQRMGELGFTLAYSLSSILVLAWLIRSAGRTPFVPLWYWQPWHSLITIFLMLFVCMIVAFSVGQANPLSFGGFRNERFDACSPGIVKWVRHPFLLVLGLWSFAHLVANGDLAHVLLFACFGIFAILGSKLVDKRKQRELGDHWHVLAVQMKSASVRLSSAAIRMTIGRFFLGIILYLSLIYSHRWLVGVSPIPPPMH